MALYNRKYAEKVQIFSKKQTHAVWKFFFTIFIAYVKKKKKKKKNEKEKKLKQSL